MSSIRAGIGQARQTPQGNDLLDNDRDQATVLADAGVDVQLTQMTVRTVYAPPVVHAAVETGHTADGKHA